MATNTQTTFTSILEISADEITLAEFEASYMATGTPCVFRQGFSCEASNWTFDSIKEKARDSKVFVRKNTNSELYRQGKKYKIVQMKFQDYINDLRQHNSRAQNRYLAVNNVTRCLAPLLEDIVQPKLIGKVHSGPHIWVGCEDHYEFNHFDPDASFLCMCIGQKKARLVSFEFLHDLQCNPLGSLGRTIQSQLGFDELPPHVTWQEAILNPGDMLYIPGFYFHQITSLTDSVSLNYFFGNSGENDFATKVIDQRLDSLLYWLCNIIDQNRALESFLPLLCNLKVTLRNFLHSQWYELLTEEQLLLLCPYIYEHLNTTKVETDAFAHIEIIPDDLPHIPRKKS